MSEETKKVEEKEETALELAKRLQAEVDEYKELVETKTTQEELDDLEKEMMKEMDKFDEYIRGVEYVLPKDVVFEGKKYTLGDVANKICYFIGSQEQTWQYVLGLYELCKLWKATPDKLSFGALDSTLRLLDQRKYSGMTEWKDILIVNEFMKPLHEAFSKDTTKQIALGQKHNAIISRRDLITPVKSDDKK